MKMLHNEARELLVRGYEATHDAEEIAKAYSVSKWTVYWLVGQKRKAGSVTQRTSQRGRKRILTKRDLTRLYVRNLSSKRVIDHAPLNTLKSTTVLSSVRLSGEKAFTTHTGGITGERFISHLKEILIPTLKLGDIVVMDNMRAHHIKTVEELLRKNGTLPLYLPPYSTDLNPIEMMWSKMKAILRKWMVRKAEKIQSAIQQALVVPADVRHWFAHFGYCCYF